MEIAEARLYRLTTPVCLPLTRVIRYLQYTDSVLKENNLVNLVGQELNSGCLVVKGFRGFITGRYSNLRKKVRI